MNRRIAISCVAVLLTGREGLTSGEDWPQWRGLNRESAWHETNVLQTFPAGGLKVTWRFPLGPGWSSPVVAQGRVYVTDVQLARPTATERVLCIDEKNGSLLWSNSYKADYPDWAFTPDTGGPRSTPIVSNQRLFTLGAMGQLLCLDAIRGTVLWKKDLAAEYEVKEYTGITGSPLIEGSLLILAICGKPAACVVAFDRDTGKEVWRALDDSFTYTSLMVFSEGGRRQLIHWSQQAVTSLDPATGRTWWREVIPTSGDMAISTPVCANHRLLVGGLMFALDPRKPVASVLWPESRAPSKRVLSNTSTALLLDNEVYSARISGELVCLDAATGRELWQTNSITSLRNGSSIHLTPNGNSVLLFTDEGNLIRARLSREGYRELSRASLLEATHPFGGRNVVWPPPAFANRHVFARNDKELVCVSLAQEP